MPINISKIIEKTQEFTDDSAGGSSALQLSRVAEIGQIIDDSSVYSAPSVSDLPTASNNKGRFVYVDSVARYYYSDGTSWLDDYVTTDLTNSQIWMWGNNNFGQLGTNNTTCYSAPQQEACGGTTWCMVSAGIYHTSSIKTDGTLWSWGANDCGVLGTNNAFGACSSTPQQEACGGTNWCSVSVGSCHTSAIKTDGTLWSWGCGGSGKLGTNDVISYSTPQQEACGGTNWCMVSAGSYHSLAIKTDGTLWSWGRNLCGVLGTNNTTCYSTPQQEVCGGTNWCMVSTGYHSSAIKTDGTLWSWGSNYCGRLGTDNTTCYSTPQQEACGGTNWCMVSSALVNTGGSHTSAIKTDGTLWSWGLNNLFGFVFYGNLGTNNTINYSTPQQEACSGTNWCMVSAGYRYASAIKTDGTLWSWGSNSNGQLGLNNTICYSTPQQEVCGFTDWNEIYLRGTIDTTGF